MKVINIIILTGKNFVINNYFTFLVLAVVLFSFLLRYLHTKIGLPYLYNWDEPQTASTALKIMKTGDFNPHFFNYGSMMIYSNFVVDVLHYLSLMGHPSTAESYLTNMNEIKINADTGWNWTISHPSFYHWNRVLTALLGAGTVLVTYLIGKHVFNKWIGLVAAIFLAVLPFHISQSAWITTDAPVAFFILTVVLFSLLFIKYKKLPYFILSLVFVGISIATKYNAALSILMPVLALTIVYFQSKESVKTYMWVLIPFIPIIVFFIIMPYAILDLTTFLEHVGFEVRHYKIMGHGSSTIAPGWENFSFQMHQFYRNLGSINIIFIGLGIVGVFFRPLLIFVLVLPAIYILYMTGMRVNFHRNFVQVYPFISILFASGIFVMYSLIFMLQKKFLTKTVRLPIIITALTIMGLLVPQIITSFKSAKIKYKTQDTRTQMISIVNSYKDVKKVLIAKELRVHKQDLNHLKVPYSIIPLIEFTSAPSDKNTLYVLPKNPSARGKLNGGKLLLHMKKYINTINKSAILKVIGGNGTTRLDRYSVNPGILLVNKIPLSPLKVNVKKH